MQHKTTTHVSIYCSLNLILIITFANKNNFQFSVVDSSIIAHNLYPKYNAVHCQCNVPRGGGVFFPFFNKTQLPYLNVDLVDKNILFQLFFLEGKFTYYSILRRNPNYIQRANKFQSKR